MPMLHTLLGAPRSQEIIRQTITTSESERIASIVMAALLSHFSTAESLRTWPLCTEAHIAHFLRVAQLPPGFVSVSLALLQELALENPLMYAEGHTAELFFIAAMQDVAFRAYAMDKSLKDLYDLRAFEYVDHRWAPVAWQRAMHDIQVKLGEAWNTCKWANLPALRKLVEVGHDYTDSENAGVIGLGIFINGLHGEREKRREETMAYFEKIYVGTSLRVDWEENLRNRSAGAFEAPPAHVRCDQHCILVENRSPAVSSFTPTPFSRDMKRGPWSPAHFKIMKGYVGRTNLTGGQVRLITHDDLAKGVQALKPIDGRRDILFLSQVTEGPYSRSCIFYARETRPSLKDMFLNDEENELYVQSLKGNKVYVDAQFDLGPVVPTRDQMTRIRSTTGGGCKSKGNGVMKKWSAWIARAGAKQRARADAMTMYKDQRRKAD